MSTAISRKRKNVEEFVGDGRSSKKVQHADASHSKDDGGKKELKPQSKGFSLRSLRPQIPHVDCLVLVAVSSTRRRKIKGQLSFMMKLPLDVLPVVRSHEFKPDRTNFKSS